MAFAAVAVGWYLNDLDKTYNIKQQVIDAMKVVPGQTAQGIYVINTKSEAWLERVEGRVEAQKKEIYLGPVIN